MHDMQCAVLNSPTSVLIGGHQTKVLELDLNKVELKNSVGTLWITFVYLSLTIIFRSWSMKIT